MRTSALESEGDIREDRRLEYPRWGYCMRAHGACTCARPSNIECRDLRDASSEPGRARFRARHTTPKRPGSPSPDMRSCRPHKRSSRLDMRPSLLRVTAPSPDLTSFSDVCAALDAGGPRHAPSTWDRHPMSAERRLSISCSTSTMAPSLV